MHYTNANLFHHYFNDHDSMPTFAPTMIYLTACINIKPWLTLTSNVAFNNALQLNAHAFLPCWDLLPKSCHSQLSIHLSPCLFTGETITSFPYTINDGLLHSFTPAAFPNKHWMTQITVSSKVRALMGDSTRGTEERQRRGEEGRESRGVEGGEVRWVNV